MILSISFCRFPLITEEINFYFSFLKVFFCFKVMNEWMLILCNDFSHLLGWATYMKCCERNVLFKCYISSLIFFLSICFIKHYERSLFCMVSGSLFLSVLETVLDTLMSRWIFLMSCLLPILRIIFMSNIFFWTYLLVFFKYIFWRNKIFLCSSTGIHYGYIIFVIYLFLMFFTLLFAFRFVVLFQ